MKCLASKWPPYPPKNRDFGLQIIKRPFKDSTRELAFFHIFSHFFRVTFVGNTQAHLACVEPLCGLLQECDDQMWVMGPIGNQLLKKLKEQSPQETLGVFRQMNPNRRVDLTKDVYDGSEMEHPCHVQL